MVLAKLILLHEAAAAVNDTEFKKTNQHFIQFHSLGLVV